jgi:DNA-binding SARP family transcriptional activator
LNPRTDDGDVTTLQQVELGVLGPLQVRQYGLPVAIPGAKPRAILIMLGLNHGSVVAADTLVELLWGDDPPRTAIKALQTHVSSLRRTLGDGFVLTEGTGWTLNPATETDAGRYRVAVKLGRDAMAAGDASKAVSRFDDARSLWRGVPELPDGRRGSSEKTLWIEGHAAMVEDRAEALLATGRAAEVIGELEAAIADAPLRERRWGQLMLALYRAGRQGEALGAFKRARALLAAELGVDPGPDLRRLEAAIVAQDTSLEVPMAQHLSSVLRAVTFLLTDIEGSTVAWETDAAAMAIALARHDEIVEQVVTFRGGRLVKTRGEGDATFSVFDRPSAAAAAAIELQEAIRHEPWALVDPMRIRIALHTGEVEFRDGDYFGRAVNRAARLRSIAAGGQTLCSGATAELVIDSLADDVVLADLGIRQLKNLTRPEHVFELRLETDAESAAGTIEVPIERPELPAVLAGPGPFVGRASELARLLTMWQATLSTGTSAVLVAGEPGVGKTRLAGEWSRQAYEHGAVVLYGRCDEDLGAPYQPFAEALRTLVPCLGSSRLRGMRGVEALLPMIPGLVDVLPDLATAPRADADTERYALFDAVVELFGIASTSAPVVLVLDDLHWAAKPTLLLLRHLLRFGEHARVQVVGTYRSTDLDRSHPLAAMLADLNRDGTANRLVLGGLDEEDVTAYLVEAGYDDEELARALVSVTGGNPFFLIEALRHVDESDGRWDPSTLPQGIREAVSRRLSRLPAETNKALAAAAVVGSGFAVELVERVVGDDLLDAFDEAAMAGIVIEEPGGRYRFNHALVRQSLLAELASVRRMRLHQKIAAALEAEPGADDELLAELAYHYFECAWSGNAGKAVEYCRRAADQAMARLAYEGAADLYDKAVHALEEIDDELPDRVAVQAELLVARCEALLAAGDVASATGAVDQLRSAAGGSVRLAAWAECFGSQLSMLTDPERLDELESAVAVAADELAGLDDAAGEAKAHTVRAGCLARLGRIGDAETALDQALTASRRAREHRQVNAVLAGAPLAALWGPNPVPRAGGRCLDVVRLLRITTGSPVVEATSTRCQGVLDALRGRAAAGRQLIDSARRSLTELGMRHALLEVEQFAGIVELVADDPASAEQHLRLAYKGFRRMGIDADTAETAALLARACLALGRDAEADELCAESERLAGHALKAAIAWRTVRAHLHSRRGSHDKARIVAEQAVAIAERTDLLVDHGDACVALAAVLLAAGDAAGARAAGERAVELYEVKGATALADKARGVVGGHVQPAPTAEPETPSIELDQRLFGIGARLSSAVNRRDWDEAEQLLAPHVVVESRRKIVGFPRMTVSPKEWSREMRRYLDVGMATVRHTPIAVRGARHSLGRLELSTEDRSSGAPQEEVLELAGFDHDGRIAMMVLFDVDDLDAALVELDAAAALGQQPRALLENAATRVADRMNEHFAASRWDEFGAYYADEVRVEDRRRGLRRESSDRAAEIANIRAVADLGIVKISTVPIALRGDRLCLTHVTLHGQDGFGAQSLVIMAVDADGLLVVQISFDPDDVQAAFAELEAQYLAGEAAEHANTWSVLLRTHAELCSHTVPEVAPDYANVDHRRGIAFAPGGLTEYVEATLEHVPDFNMRIEKVHGLSEIGAVVTFASSGTSQEGFDAEWRMVLLMAVSENLMNRCEIFDEDNLDSALARLDELNRPAARLENAASRMYERYNACFAVRDWLAMAEMIADDVWNEDRRRVVNGGIQRGRDAVLTNMRAVADVGVKNNELSVIAIRGDRLGLLLQRASGARRPEAYGAEVLIVVEVDAESRFTTGVAFDPADVDAAYAELETRYLAGEAEPYAHTWSLVAETYAAFNRQELSPRKPDWVNIDHRPGAAPPPGDMAAYVSQAWDITPGITTRIEADHRLNDRGAVFVHTESGTSAAGFAAEWREVNLLMFDGDLISRCELFDESDLDAAIARFDELNQRATKLENAASRATARFDEYLAARDWDGMATIFLDGIRLDDRRRLVGDEFVGRQATIANMKASADTGVKNVTTHVVAVRGERLTLQHVRINGKDQRPEAFRTEALVITEVDGLGRISAFVMMDLDDVDAAFVELDNRYLAGEAAPCADTWSALVDASAAFNQHELPATTPDWQSVDHRSVIGFEPGDMMQYMQTTFDVARHIKHRIVTVHRLSELGAVLTQATYSTSREGFDAEWHEVALLTFEGAAINRCEVFDTDDLDAALARFDELSTPAT